MSIRIVIGVLMGLTVLASSLTVVVAEHRDVRPSHQEMSQKKAIAEQEQQERQEKILREIPKKKYLFHGSVYVPVSQEQEQKETINDNGQKLFAFRSYNETTKQDCIVYFLIQRNDGPVIQSVVFLDQQTTQPV